MISVEEAYQLIDSCKRDFGTEKIYFQEAVNRVISTPVLADRDFPSYDRVTMDGIAISSDAFAKGRNIFFIEKTIAAGSPVQSIESSDNCVEVMTGAVLPLNADVVIPYEQCGIQDGNARVMIDYIKSYQNIHRKGTDEKKGAILIEKNTRLSPAHISVLATVGMVEIEVYKLPSVAVCSTGDELVPVDQTPLPHQVRQSNGYLLAADLEKEKIKTHIYHLRDDKEEMEKRLREILQQHDVILLSGAVSKGKFDYLPQALEALDMKTIFHRVAQRPGKPFLFGIIEGKPVFGFPGNPVSTFVCYHLYFKYWLSQCYHQPANRISVKLSTDVVLSSPLTNHVLVKIKYEKGECLAEPVLFSTSGDIPSLLGADGIITLPPRKEEFLKGEVFDVIPCR